MLKNPLEGQYNLIVALNLVFFFLVVSFLVYFNPYGHFTLTGSSSTLVLESYQVKILLTLVTLVVVSNIIIIKHSIKQKVFKGKL